MIIVIVKKKRPSFPEFISFYLGSTRKEKILAANFVKKLLILVRGVIKSVDVI
jgi:hypothetical protein